VLPSTALVPTDAGDLLCQDAAGRHVHRVGFEPEPWAWTPWQYAENGRFSGRWDDPDGVWRSVYVGESRLACYLEVLAFARADPQLQDDLSGIDESPEDGTAHPSLPGGVLPDSWRWPRRIGEARLAGWHAVPGDKESLPTLRARFLALAIKLRLPDVDAAAIRLAEPRGLTQAIAAWLYDQTASDGVPLAGVQFSSRHGEALTLWAVFERPGDDELSALLREPQSASIDEEDPELREAMRIHRLQWSAAD
jgi:hypothetical protein